MPARAMRASAILPFAMWATISLAACPGASGPSLEELLARVDAQVDESIPQMTDCFERELPGGASAVSGLVVVRFEIGGDGLVQKLDITESEVGLEEADLCVADTIRRIYFAEWVGRRPVRLTKPLRFSAGR